MDQIKIAAATIVIIAAGLIAIAVRSLWSSIKNMSFDNNDTRGKKLKDTDGPMDAALTAAGMKRKWTVLETRLQASLQLSFRGSHNLHFYDGGDFGIGVYEISDTRDAHPPLMTVYIHLLKFQSPHLYFDNKHNNHHFRANLPEKISKAQLVYCEGYFSDRYDLYAPVGYAIDSLVVGGPDVLDAIDRLSLGADIEVIGNQLYMIFPDEIDLPRMLEEIVTNGAELAKEFNDNLSRYRDERAISPSQSVGYQGRWIIRK